MNNSGSRCHQMLTQMNSAQTSVIKASTLRGLQVQMCWRTSTTQTRGLIGSTKCQSIAGCSLCSLHSQPCSTKCAGSHCSPLRPRSARSTNKRPLSSTPSPSSTRECSSSSHSQAMLSSIPMAAGAVS